MSQNLTGHFGDSSPSIMGQYQLPLGKDRPVFERRVLAREAEVVLRLLVRESLGLASSSIVMALVEEGLSCHLIERARTA